MTKELIQAMLDGKKLYTKDGIYDGWYSNSLLRFRMGKISELGGVDLDWFLDWQIKPELKTRPMTNFEAMQKAIDEPNMVWRIKGDKTILLGGLIDSNSDDMEVLEYNYLENGKLKNEEWKKFEVTE